MKKLIIIIFWLSIILYGVTYAQLTDYSNIQSYPPSVVVKSKGDSPVSEINLAQAKTLEVTLSRPMAAEVGVDAYLQNNQGIDLKIYPDPCVLNGANKTCWITLMPKVNNPESTVLRFKELYGPLAILTNFNVIPVGISSSTDSLNISSKFSLSNVVLTESFLNASTLSTLNIHKYDDKQTKTVIVKYLGGIPDGLSYPVYLSFAMGSNFHVESTSSCSFTSRNKQCSFQVQYDGDVDQEATDNLSVLIFDDQSNLHVRKYQVNYFPSSLYKGLVIFDNSNNRKAYSVGDVKPLEYKVLAIHMGYTKNLNTIATNTNVFNSLVTVFNQCSNRTYLLNGQRCDIEDDLYIIAAGDDTVTQKVNNLQISTPLKPKESASVIQSNSTLQVIIKDIRFDSTYMIFRYTDDRSEQIKLSKSNLYGDEWVKSYPILEGQKQISSIYIKMDQADYTYDVRS